MAHFSTAEENKELSTPNLISSEIILKEGEGK